MGFVDTFLMTGTYFGGKRKKNHGVSQNLVHCVWLRCWAGSEMSTMDQTTGKHVLQLHPDLKVPLWASSSYRATPQPVHPCSWQLAPSAGSQATAWPQTQKMYPMRRCCEALYRGRHGSSSQHSLESCYPWATAPCYSAMETQQSYLSWALQDTPPLAVCLLLVVQ